MDMDKNNEAKIPKEYSHTLNVDDHENCSYCNKPFIERLWCKECDPRCMIEGWTSGNHDVDKFIKDTIYEARKFYFSSFIEWVPFDRFENVKQISEGDDEFSRMYSATWIDGQATYTKHNDGSWEKLDPKPMVVALKRLNGHTDESLNEVTNFMLLRTCKKNFFFF
jgi:hypothetical protein